MERLTVNELITGTIETVQANGRTAGLYVGVLAALATALEWGLGSVLGGADPLVSLPNEMLALLGIGAGIGGILVVIVAVVAQYLLWEAMLQNTALFSGAPQGRRYLAFVGLSILMALGTGFALLLLIVPGLIVASRWVAAPAFLIRQRCGVIEAMGRNWDSVRGNTAPIFWTLLIGIVAMSVIGGMTGGATLLSDRVGATPGFFSVLIGQVVGNVGTVLQVAFGVYVFRRLTGGADDVGSVFD